MTQKGQFRVQHADLAQRMDAILARGVGLTFSELCAALGVDKKNRTASSLFYRRTREGVLVKTGECRRGKNDRVESEVWIAAEAAASTTKARRAGVTPAPYRRGFRWGMGAW